MSFPASGKNVKLGKGALMLAAIAADGSENGLDFMGNANSIALAAEISQVELYSSTQAAASLLARDRQQISYTVTVSLNEYTKKNLEYFLSGTQAQKSQGAEPSDSAVFNDVRVGAFYELGSRKVTGVVVMVAGNTDPLTLNTDYSLDAEFGVIGIKDSGAIVDGDDVTVTFGTPAVEIDQIRIATAGSKIARLVYMSDDANQTGNASKDRLECWRVDVAPDGELNFISDEYGAFSLTMALLTDEENHPDDPYGTLDRIAA